MRRLAETGGVRAKVRVGGCQLQEGPCVGHTESVLVQKHQEIGTGEGGEVYLPVAVPLYVGELTLSVSHLATERRI